MTKCYFFAVSPSNPAAHRRQAALSQLRTRRRSPPRSSAGAPGPARPGAGRQRPEDRSGPRRAAPGAAVPAGRDRTGVTPNRRRCASQGPPGAGSPEPTDGAP